MLQEPIGDDDIDRLGRDGKVSRVRSDQCERRMSTARVLEHADGPLNPDRESTLLVERCGVFAGATAHVDDPRRFIERNECLDTRLALNEELLSTRNRSKPTTNRSAFRARSTCAHSVSDEIVTHSVSGESH